LGVSGEFDEMRSFFEGSDRKVFFVYHRDQRRKVLSAGAADTDIENISISRHKQQKRQRTIFKRN
jgi:hypothetical protein